MCSQGEKVKVKTDSVGDGYKLWCQGEKVKAKIDSQSQRW